MKYLKYKAFTLAEVMILMLTLAVLLAAFAPIMTRKQNNVSFDDVWSYVPSNTKNNDAYFDVANKSFTSQAFIGIPAKKALDVASSSSNLYSKLVIRSSSKLKYENKPQGQMQFRYGDSATGTFLGTLFAGRGNFLLGGTYKNIQVDVSDTTTNLARWNTAFGQSALNSLTTGKSNTAVGYGALSSLTTASDNVAVGYNAGNKTTAGYNTFVGTNAGSTVTTGEYNTMLGYTTGSSVVTKGSKNTLLGSNHSSALTTGFGNTSAGYSALGSLTTGYYNTAIGSRALQNVTTGSFNTAVGYNTGHLVSEGSYKTFVGAFSGTHLDTDKQVPHEGLYKDVHERVFIGALPKNTVGTNNEGPGAVLEVHNINAKDESNHTLPIPGLGYSSVVVNGNLIVRGTTYLESLIWRPATYDDKTLQLNQHLLPKGLVAYKIARLDNNVNAFMGYDGARRDSRSFARCNRRRCQLHDFNDLRTNCICTTVGSYIGNTNYASQLSKVKQNTGTGSTSYDWISPSTGSITYGDDGDDNGTICNAGYHVMGNQYKDAAVGGTVYLERNSEWKNPNRANGNNTDYRHVSRGDHRALGTDQPLAHLKGMGQTADGRYWEGRIYSSCCPNLTDGAADERVGESGPVSSDARLKDIGDKFTAGLAQIKQINVYNFTFKNDVRKLPQVGVMAQDLKRVFPNAVKKDEHGYYQIRWDEMFYAVVNSVKELNMRIEKLASKISTDKAKVAALKKDNQELNAKLDSLEAELTVLEAKRNKN